MSHTNSTPKPEANMSDHTPGPWHIVTDEHGNTEIITDSRPYICTVAPGKCEDVTVANARLIAAAPELLEALMSILDYAPEMELCIASKYGGDSFTYVGFRGYIADAKAAVSKALGE